MTVTLQLVGQSEEGTVVVIVAGMEVPVGDVMVELRNESMMC